MAWIAAYSDVLEMHNELVQIFRDEDDPISPPGVRSDDLLQSACTRPNTSIVSHEKYPTTKENIAALFHSLTKNHAFHNGNKRTALVALITSLHMNDYRLKDSVTDDVLYDFVVDVTDDRFPKQDARPDADETVVAIARWLDRNTSRANRAIPSMDTGKFLEACKKAGAQVRKSGGSWLVAHHEHSIKISNSTPQMSGPVVRKYLSRLGLNLSGSGLDFEEFQHGATAKREQIRRFMQALRRLAKT